jgi:uncharacterized protein (DUF2141 family)
MLKVMIGLIVLVNILMAYSIDLKIKNLKSTKGNLSIGLYQKAENFPKRGQSDKKMVIKASEQNYKFTHLKQGVYAMAIYHDENGNGELDKNWVDYPTEAVGFSNNATIGFSAPSFEEAKFELQNDVTIIVNME